MPSNFSVCSSPSRPRIECSLLTHSTFPVCSSPVGLQIGCPRIPPARGPASSCRGKITGFSVASVRRLRHFLFHWSGPGDPLSCTCTLRAVRDAEQWRSAVDAFGKRICRAGGCYVWRVELQRRGTPHLHLVAWGCQADTLRSAWLGVWGLERDPDHIRHAVHVDRIAGDPSRWFAYLCAHTSKHKAGQLGWSGRQWGVVGRERMTSRTDVRHEVLPSFGSARLLDVYNRWLRLYHPEVAPFSSSGGVRFVSPEISGAFFRLLERKKVSINRRYSQIFGGRDSTKRAFGPA